MKQQAGGEGSFAGAGLASDEADLALAGERAIWIALGYGLVP